MTVDGGNSELTDALQGVRILEFSRHMAAPFATQILSDFGADVVKVESFPDGDPSRRAGTQFVGDDSALYLNWNHGKRSIVVDLHDERGLEIVERLVERVDVVVENYRPGVADAIGVGYERLSSANPALIYCSLSAFGQTGPWAGQPGTDPVVQALSGVMYVTGEAGGSPVRVGVPMADYVGALTLAQAILLGLAARGQTGSGQRIDVSMLHAMLMSLSTRAASFWASGEEPQRFGSAHSEVAPYQAFETADGYVVAGAWAEDSWPRFCQAIEREDLVDDPRFATNPARVEHRVELVALIQEVIRQRTTEEWEQRFFRAKALFAPVVPVSQALSHPQTAGQPAVHRVEHPSYGSIPAPAPAITMHGTPGRVRSHAPMLGEHTREILGELGYPPAEVDALLRDRIALSVRSSQAVRGGA